MLCPVATCKQMSESVAEGGSDPFGAQTHSGEQVSSAVATRRMNRQSVATGLGPELTGCEQAAVGGSVVVVLEAVEDVEVELDVVTTPTHPISIGST